MCKCLKKTLVFVLAVLMTVSVFAGCATKTDTTVTDKKGDEIEVVTPKEPTVIKFKSVLYAPDIADDEEFHQSDMGKYLLEKFNIKVVAEGTKGAEWTQALTTFFAAGADADILSFWLSHEEQKVMMRKIAADGLLADLKDVIAKYAPNLQPVIDPANQEQALQDTFTYAPEYKDKVYFLPNGITANGIDVGLQDHGASIRKDIVEMLDIDPLKITTSEELYEVLKKTKALNLKDLQGKPLIPAGTWEVGWDINNLTRSYDFGHRTNWAPYGDDKRVTHWFMTDWAEKKILYIRKLIAEGLLDQECITQNGNTAREKLANASIGVFGLNKDIPNIWFPQLVEEHPEYEFTELGPLKNHFGETTKYQISLTNQCLAVLNSTKNLETVIKLLDWANSPEGRIFANYGIVGKTYYINDQGFPRMLDDYFNMSRDESRKDEYEKFNKQVGRTWLTVFTEMGNPNGSYNKMEIFGEPGAGTSNTPGYMENLLNKVKIYTPKQVIVKGYNVKAFESSAPNRERMEPVLKQINEVAQRAYYAKTEDEALKIINDFRKIMKDNGYGELEEYVNQECAKRNDMVYYLNW